MSVSWSRTLKNLIYKTHFYPGARHFSNSLFKMLSKPVSSMYSMIYWSIFPSEHNLLHHVYFKVQFFFRYDFKNLRLLVFRQREGAIVPLCCCHCHVIAALESFQLFFGEYGLIWVPKSFLGSFFYQDSLFSSLIWFLFCVFLWGSSSLFRFLIKVYWRTVSNFASLIGFLIQVPYYDSWGKIYAGFAYHVTYTCCLLDWNVFQFCFLRKSNRYFFLF